MNLIIKILPRDILDKIRKVLFWYNYFFFKFFKKVPYPKTIVIDPINVCNLNCPLCPTGTGKLRGERGTMSFDLFKNVIDQIPTLNHISLFNWGESFLNKEIFKIIRYAKRKNILISIHSNLSLEKDDDFWEKLVDSGFDGLEVSLDGACPETYNKYRKGGDFNLVLKNVKKIVEIKKQKKADLPKITWKFIVSKHNENEIDKAKSMAEEIGINFEYDFLEVGDINPDVRFEGSVLDRTKEWLPREKKYIRDLYRYGYRRPIFSKKCDQLFTTLTVSPQGKVFPCCWLADDKNSFGDLSVESFAKIWNNENYTIARKLFSRRKFKENYQGSIICNKCINFSKPGDKRVEVIMDK